MNNIIVLPLIIPVLTGVFLVFFSKYLHFQRWFSVVATFANFIVSVAILIEIQQSGILRLDFGAWLPPYGILFVADSFSMLLVATTSFITTICLIYAIYSLDEKREKLYFYPFVHLLIAGVNGSFLTGDLFNLFVCFEVMLLASYALITLGGTKKQLKESIKYIVINVLSSSFFLIAIAYLYGVLGTLNMAHLSVRIAESGQTPVITAISLIFLIVFGIKSGLVLFQWLPGSYSAPPTVIAALFGALLTKVGVYAMFRMFTLLFYHQPNITHTLIGVMAGATLILGSIGAIAYKDIRLIITYNVIISIGFIFIGLVAGTPEALSGSIYYLVHDMIVKALLFLVAGTFVFLVRTNQYDEVSGAIRNYPVLGWTYFGVMLSLTGIPPFSGFLGKMLIGQGAIDANHLLLIFIGFLSSLFVLYSLLKIFLESFWGETMISKENETPLPKGLIIPSLILLFATIALGVGAEGIAEVVTNATKTLLNPSIYIDAVLNQSM